MSATVPIGLLGTRHLPDRPAVYSYAFGTPSFGSNFSLNAFSVLGKTTIDAEPRILLTTLLNTATYAHWNSFCPRATIQHQTRMARALPFGMLAVFGIANLDTVLRLGTEFTLDVNLPSRRNRAGKSPNQEPTPVQLEVTRVLPFDWNGHKGIRIAFRSKPSGWRSRFALQYEIVQELLFPPDDDLHGAVHYTGYVTFIGALGRVVRSLKGRALAIGLGEWMNGLKEHCEAQQMEETRRAEEVRVEEVSESGRENEDEGHAADKGSAADQSNEADIRNEADQSHDGPQIHEGAHNGKGKENDEQ